MPSSASSAAQPSSGAIGRFQLIRLLGKGNQSEVYLAHDPHLEREVAIKTLHFASPGERAANMESLLTEARTVSRLQHPNIVALYDAGEHDGDPYLVFEYVNGHTLAQVLQKEGPIPPTRAAEWAVQILDAIGYAHAAGIVHRDLKPSNVLIGANGAVRVMDFGIASRIDNKRAKSGYLMGTPAYMAPEYISNEDFGPKSDIFSFGMLLYELLTGQHAIQGKDTHEVMRRIVQDPIPSPSKHNDQIDERLDDLVLRALKKDPSERFYDAGQMKDALELYLSPTMPDIQEGVDSKQSTLEFLLRRMRVKGDFPALSESVTSINRIASSDKESVNKLSNSVLKDFALTNKLLKLVNSVMYSQFDSGSISTISRAVVILGFDSVRSIALSLMLFDNLQNKGHAQQLKEEFVRSLFSGMLARSLAGRAQVKDAEEAFICSMFHNLGRTLSMFYFPEETTEIQKLIQAKDVSEDKAATQVLGLSFVDLGVGIAKTWGFPDSMLLSMRSLPDEKIKKGISNGDRLRILSGFSNELSEVITNTPEHERGAAVARLSAKFGDCLSVNEKQIGALVEKSLQDIAQFSSAVNVNLKQSKFAKQAAQWANKPAAPAASASAIKGMDTDTQIALAATMLHEPKPQLDLAVGEAGIAPLRSTEEIQSILSSGLQDISNSLIDDSIKVNDILRMILETMYTGMSFNHVLFCIKDGRQNAMMGKFGFGENVQVLIKGFQFPMAEPAQPDVFHLALKNNADILITDIDDHKIASHVPAWYRQSCSARTFLIFPIVIKGKPIGMIYADRPKPGDITVPEKELSLLKSLRNQAVLAIRQTL
ncbi:MAG: protein kinase [Burkholderiales bacterium]|nr:protein kinase [Burkholderiales bacterium]